MGFVLAAVAGIVVGFGAGRSMTYERWLRDRRDLAAIRQRQRLHSSFNQKEGKR